MGSLMAGWDSAVKDPKTVMFQRNKSLTKEEIDAYWKSKKLAEEEHVSAVTVLRNENQENIHGAVIKKMQRSSSFPLGDRKDSMNTNDSEKEKPFNSRTCWWTRSNLAFLNEPPVISIEGPHKYASQYNVAQFGSSTNNNPIGA